MTDYEQAPDFEDEEEDEELKVYTEVGHEVPGRPPWCPVVLGVLGWAMCSDVSHPRCALAGLW